MTIKEKQEEARLGVEAGTINPRHYQDLLRLNNLCPEAVVLVESGYVNYTNAHALSRLPHDRQREMLEKARTSDPAHFIPACYK